MAMEQNAARRRRSAILAVAWEAFQQDGYAGTSMSSIAARLGGSKGTLYNYFSSKEELLTAVVEEKGQQFHAQLAGLPNKGGDVRQTLTKIGTTLLQTMLSDEFIGFYRLVLAEAERLPRLGLAVSDMSRQTALAPLSQYLKEAMRSGEIRIGDPLEAAELFSDLCGAIIHRRRLLAVPPDVSTEEIQRNAERAVTMFLAEYRTPA